MTTQQIVKLSSERSGNDPVRNRKINLAFSLLWRSKNKDAARSNYSCTLSERTVEKIHKKTISQLYKRLDIIQNG